MNSEVNGLWNEVKTDRSTRNIKRTLQSVIVKHEHYVNGRCMSAGRNVMKAAERRLRALKCTDMCK